MAVMANPILPRDFEEIVTDLDDAYRAHDSDQITKLETELDACIEQMDSDYRMNERGDFG